MIDCWSYRKLLSISFVLPLLVHRSGAELSDNSLSQTLSQEADKIFSSQTSPNANVQEDSVDARNLYQEALDILSAESLSAGQLSSAMTRLEKASVLGHAPANKDLASLYFFGQVPHLEPDYRKCASYVDKCQEADCYFLRGLLHSNGLGGKSRSLPHALVYFGMAATAEHDGALMVLGNRYAAGLGVDKVCPKARDYLMPVADKLAKKMETERIVTQIRASELSDDPSEHQSGASVDVVEFYQFNADSGDVSAQYFLGQVFYLGVGGITRDMGLARYYFGLAAQENHMNAIAYLAQMDLYGEGADQPNYSRAYHNFRRAIKEKVPVAYNGLGLLYWKGLEVVQDLDEAAKYFKQAADLDYAEAWYNLAMVYKQSENQMLIGTDERVFTSLVQAMRLGYTLAVYELARLNASKDLSCGLSVYLLQNFLEKNTELEILNKAYEEYYAGYSSWALSKFLYYAEMGSELAAFNTAYIMERMKTGDIHSNRRRALVWWNRAANVGSIRARVFVGDYFYYGWGLGEPDYIAAAANYHNAVERRSSRGAFNIGYMHEHGIGMIRDFDLARRYYYQAETLGIAAGRPEVWLPVALALYKLEAKIRLYRLRRFFVNLPRWTIPVAAIIVFGITTALLALYKFWIALPRRELPTPTPTSNLPPPENALAANENDPLL